MKHFLILPLLACAATLTGCVAEGPGGLVVHDGAAYPGYYGRGYYNESPPGPYYEGGVAVVRTDVYHERGYRDGGYDRDGRRTSRAARDGDSRNRDRGYRRDDNGRPNAAPPGLRPPPPPGTPGSYNRNNRRPPNPPNVERQVRQRRGEPDEQTR